MFVDPPIWKLKVRDAGVTLIWGLLATETTTGTSSGEPLVGVRVTEPTFGVPAFNRAGFTTTVAVPGVCPLPPTNNHGEPVLPVAVYPVGEAAVIATDWAAGTGPPCV